MKIFDIAIIGAGASGLMCAAHIKNASVALIDSNAKIGLKILASGGGKCNVTNKNVSEKNYLGNAEFIKEALKNFTPQDLLKFLELFKLELETRKYGQYFCKNSAKDLVAIFEKMTRKCELFLSQKVSYVEFNKNFIIHTQDEKIEAKKLIVASGGVSYATLGASDIGYEIAKSFGHTIKTPTPALVGFTVQKEQFWMKNLSGVSFYAKLRVENKTFESELLFTHKGMSGPVVLSTSLYWNKGKIEANFLPNVDLKKILDSKSSKQISSVLPLPKRFIKEFLTSINIADIAISKLTCKEKEALQSLQNYEFSPAGNFGFTKVEVTKGGVNTDEINSQTFESKVQENLYFIGEVLNVTGELGGYNFQWAFASAIACANHV